MQIIATCIKILSNLTVREVYMKKSPHHIRHECSKAVRKAQNENYEQEIKKMKEKDKKEIYHFS